MLSIRPNPDLAIMSIEKCEKLIRKFELYKLIDEGIDAKKEKR